MSIFQKIIKDILQDSKTAPKSQPQTNNKRPLDEPLKQNDQSSKVKNYKIAGVSHYKENILYFASKNPKFSMTKKEMIAADLSKIYEYNFKTGRTELIPEPTNPHDPNAIKVLIDGKHVGYIKKGSCKHILNILNQDRIEKIDSKIGGGNYKTLDFNGEGDLILKRGHSEYSIDVSIIER